MEERDLTNDIDCEDEIEVIEIDTELPAKGRKRRKKDKPKNEVPSVQRAWKVGYCAAQANVPEIRNPFLDDTSEFTAWLDGWWSGFYEEPMNCSFAAK